MCFTIIFNSKIFLQIWHSLTKSLLFVFSLILLKILLAYSKASTNSFHVSKKVLNLVKVRWIYCTCFYASSHRNFNLIQKGGLEARQQKRILRLHIFWGPNHEFLWVDDMSIVFAGLPFGHFNALCSKISLQY